MWMGPDAVDVVIARPGLQAVRLPALAKTRHFQGKNTKKPAGW
jgi:hypothetical protein